MSWYQGDSLFMVLRPFLGMLVASAWAVGVPGVLIYWVVQQGPAEYGGQLLAWALVIGVPGYFLYPIPTIIAVFTERRTMRVAALNMLLGWTVIGWFWSIYMAIKREEKSVD